MDKTMKKCKEWTVDTVWGKVAMVAWGEPTNPPVLLLHGYMDSAATFILLVEQLPDTYYYVGFDNPGHGKSDPYPIGPLANQVTLIEVIHRVVTHMGWDKFIVMSHSMGFINAIFYHTVYPNRITSMVNIDCLPAITHYYAIQDVPDFWYDYFYNAYYDTFQKNYEGAPLQSLEQVLSQLMVNRNLSREQAAVVASRSFEHVRGDMYRSTRQNMVRKLSQFPVMHDTIRSAILTNPPRMLNLIAYHRSDRMGRDLGSSIMEELDKDPRHSAFIVDGAHDVHITNPEELVGYIVEFLGKDELNKVTSKL